MGISPRLKDALNKKHSSSKLNKSELSMKIEHKHVYIRFLAFLNHVVMSVDIAIELCHLLLIFKRDEASSEIDKQKTRLTGNA